MSEDTVSVTEAAERLGVTTMTIRRWIQAGRLPARRLPGAKPYRIRRADLEALEDGADVVVHPRPDGLSDADVALHPRPTRLVSATMRGQDAAQLLLDAAESEAS